MGTGTVPREIWAPAEFVRRKTYTKNKKSPCHHITDPFTVARVDFESVMSSPDLGGTRVLPESTCGVVRDDTAAFVRQLRAYAEGAKVRGKLPVGYRPSEHPVERVVEDMFDWSAPVFVARAPGRLDVMGGIADYSGSLVLQMPIAEACHVAVQFRNLERSPEGSRTDDDDPLGEPGTTTVVSLNANASHTNATPRVFRSATSEILTRVAPARALTRDDAQMTRIRDACADAKETRARENAPSFSWAAYPLGVLAVLEHALTCKGVLRGEEEAATGGGGAGIDEPHGETKNASSPFPGFKERVGVSVLVSSAVPEGAGVSSSAALETAVAHAACAALAAYLPDSFVRGASVVDTFETDASVTATTHAPSPFPLPSNRRVFACDEAAGAAIARWCQTAEHFAADAPCGIMDQMACGLGEENALLALLCRPAEVVRRAVPLPRGVRIWGIDSGNAHKVGGGAYGAVRAAAFMCRTAVAARLAEDGKTDEGDETRPSSAGWPRPITALVTKEAFDAMIGPSWLETGGDEEDEEDARDEARVSKPPLPPLGEAVGGDAFLARFPGGHGDDGVTEVDPEKAYDVTLAGRHPVLENERVRAFYDAIVDIGEASSRREKQSAEKKTRADEKDQTRASLSALGASMFASHASYGALGLGDAGTDALVGMVRDRLAGRVLYGAKITGGGSGGTVCVLAADVDADGSQSEAAIEDVRAEYARARGFATDTDAAALPHLFRGSSPGAASYGTLALRLDGE